MGKTAWTAFVLVATVLGHRAVEASARFAADVCDQTPASRIPARAAGAETATEFVHDIAAVDGDAREAAIGAQILAGNVPQFLRRLVPVEMRANVPGGVHVVVCALPDYLAIGSDPDFLRVPMRLATALTIADAYGFVLPTAKIVDAIAAQASAHLAPQPLPAGPEMRSTAYYLEHNDLIEAQRLTLGVSLGALTTGDKKDLVITNRLWSKPSSVAIYGWHRLDGTPIQPLSTLHGERYADYSHGVRLIGSLAYVDDEPRSLVDLLQDPDWAPALSDEGPMARVTELMAALRAR
jgi:hypothetical protein